MHRAYYRRSKTVEGVNLPEHMGPEVQDYLNRLTFEQVRHSGIKNQWSIAWDTYGQYSVRVHCHVEAALDLSNMMDQQVVEELQAIQVVTGASSFNNVEFTVGVMRINSCEGVARGITESLQ